MMNPERLSPEEELESYELWERAAQELCRVLPAGSIWQNKATASLVCGNRSTNLRTQLERHRDRRKTDALLCSLVIKGDDRE